MYNRLQALDGFLPESARQDTQLYTFLFLIKRKPVPKELLIYPATNLNRYFYFKGNILESK